MEWAEYYTVALATVAVLAALSRAANRRFAGHDRLPMQWSLSGEVVWTASRRVALSFTPVLAALLMLGTATLLTFGPETVETRPSGLSALGVMAASFVGVHLLHLYLLARSLRREP